MKEYSDFPPLKYFLRVLKSCPKSALLYIQLWKKKGKHMTIVIPKGDIRKDYLISPTMFRNLIVALMFLNLLLFSEDGEKYELELIGPLKNDQ